MAVTVLATGGLATVASAAAGPGNPAPALGGVPVVGGLPQLPQTPLPTLPVLAPGPSGCVVLCLPTPPPTTPPTLPIPPVCVTACVPANGGTPNPGGGTPAPGTQTGGGQAPASSSPAAVVPGPASSGGGGTRPGAGLGAAHGGAAPLGGLDLAQPAPVEQLTPLAGISFGQAPYVWPLFLILDVFAAAAVAIAVRKTWSTSRVD